MFSETNSQLFTNLRVQLPLEELLNCLSNEGLLTGPMSLVNYPKVAQWLNSLPEAGQLYHVDFKQPNHPLLFFPFKVWVDYHKFRQFEIENEADRERYKQRKVNEQTIVDPPISENNFAQMLLNSQT